jgi:hypothetical protein
MATQTITGTAGNDAYRLVSGITAILDGLGGTDSLDLGTSLRSAYSITLASDGSVHLDSLTTASGGTPAHLTLVNMEILTFNSGRDTVNLLTYFGKSILGTNASDILQSTSVNETIDGGAGTDTAVFNATRAASTLSKISTGWTLTSAIDGTDTLINIERLKFSDKTIALDIDGTAGQCYRIYKAAFARTPDLAGLGYWISTMDKGTSLQQVAAGFIGSAEFQSVYETNPSNEVLINKFYTNVLGRAPDSTGANYWIGILNDHKDTIENVLSNISESSENKASLIGVIGNGFEYTPY